MKYALAVLIQFSVGLLGCGEKQVENQHAVIVNVDAWQTNFKVYDIDSATDFSASLHGQPALYQPSTQDPFVYRIEDVNNTFAAGDELDLNLVHKRHGRGSFRVVVPEQLRDFIGLHLSPPLAEWSKEMLDSSDYDEALTISWTPLQHVNHAEGILSMGKHILFASYDAEYLDGELVFDPRRDPEVWSVFKSNLANEMQFGVKAISMWQEETSFGTSQIQVSFLAAQWSWTHLLPAKIEGSYDLSASYLAESDGYYIENDFVDVFTIGQEDSQLSINGMQATGTVSGKWINMEGQLLEGAEYREGVSQHLSGQVQNNGTIKGNITGAIMESYFGSETPQKASIVQGSFLLTPRQ